MKRINTQKIRASTYRLYLLFEYFSGMNIHLVLQEVDTSQTDEEKILSFKNFDGNLSIYFGNNARNGFGFLDGHSIEFFENKIKNFQRELGRRKKYVKLCMNP